MKLNPFKITLLAFLVFGVFSCNDGKTTTQEALEDAAEASDEAISYEVDTEESYIKWEGKKPTATHFGTVKLASGVLFTHQGEVEAGNFTVDMTSITVEDLQGDERNYLEAHLKGLLEGKEGDFFDTKQYPTSTFEMTGIEGNTVKGNLTIKDKTNPVQFEADVKIEGDKLVIESPEFGLDRTKWGITFMSRSVFTDLGDKFVNDTMKITVYIVAKKQ